MNQPVNQPAPATPPDPAPQPGPALRPRTQALQPPAQEPGGSMAPECHDEVCITCSDTAVAVTIARLLPGGLAIVDTEAGQEEVSVALVDAGVGDTILVHAGEAIAVVPA
jgi:hydrogenase expression/formation protein HypC